MNANDTEKDTEKFVAAAAKARGLTLDPHQLQRVATIYERNASIAVLVMDFLPPAFELDPVFTPLSDAVASQRHREKPKKPDER